MLFLFTYDGQPTFRDNFFLVSCVLSLVGWGLLQRKNISDLRTVLGLLLICVTPIGMMYMLLSPRIRDTDPKFALICGFIYAVVFFGGLIRVGFFKRNGGFSLLKRVIFLVSALIASAQSWMYMIFIFKLLGAFVFFILANFLLAYILLKIYSLNKSHTNEQNTKKADLIANTLFWIYALLTEFIFFSMSAGSI
ncbi:MAG: hypothetical protein ACTTKL_02780 [Treponema sp.]